MNLDPNWVGVAIAAGGMVGGWIVAARASRHGTEIALAKFEERLASQGAQVGRLQDRIDDQGGLLADHAVRIGVLENEVGLRAPLDYPARR